MPTGRTSSIAPAARVWTLTAALAATGVLLAARFVVGAEGPLSGRFPLPTVVLWTAFLLAEIFYVQVIFRREGYSFSLMEVPLVVGLWFASGPAVVGAHVAATFVAFCFHRKHRGVKLWFNVAHVLVESTIAVTVFHALGPGDDPLRPGAIAVTMLASGAAVTVAASSIGAAIVLYEGGVDMVKLVLASVGNVVASLTNASLGLIAVILLFGAPVSVALLVPPAVMLVLSYRSVILNRRKHESLEFLYQASTILHRGAVQEAPMTELLELTRGTLGADVAELTLYSPEDPSRGLRIAVGPGDQVHGFESVVVSPAAADAEVGSAAHGVLVADLEGQERTLGRIVVAQPRASRRSFSSREAQLFTTLANQVEVTIENGALEASIAELTTLKEELRHRAFHDALTGLANRAMFVEELERTVAGAPPDEQPAVVFIDLDDFKTVNDTLGHAAGDELLQVIAERLRRCVRPSDLAARLGGDEFAVLIPGRDAEAVAALVAERLLGSLRSPITLSGEPVHVAASVGVARSVDGSRDPDELLQKADMAMYSAKVGGKGRWAAFKPEMQDAVSSRHALKNRLLTAMQNDEFVLHYQPILDVQEGRVVGVEALLRWAGPEQGLVMPGEFIPIAEELGLMGQIGRYVLATAGRQLRQWHDEMPGGQDLPFVSVNVTAGELQEGGFAAGVDAILEETGLDPGALVLEITEGTVVDQATPVARTLQSLRERGIRIAVDDFGTGYSSLSYLDNLSIDIIKVAKPFVDALSHAANRPTLAQAIVQLGGALRMDVVAEGIESADQLAALQAMGCPRGQGYLLGRPAPAEQVRDAVVGRVPALAVR